jgi:methylthioribose-1-phosphate isomerase
MNIDGKHYRTIWEKAGDPAIINVIDQTRLPHSFEIRQLVSPGDFVAAIRGMLVRGAGLIGATAAYGMRAAALAAPDHGFGEHMQAAARTLMATRPTATNLEWAVRRQLEAMSQAPAPVEKRRLALETAREIADFDAECCRSIGLHGLGIIEQLARAKNGETVNILTHCNAGWLAFVDYGSATAPIYAAFERGIRLHIWVDETRPRCQGASLTAWELGRHGVPHSLIVDNAGGHLMQHGLVDLVIVGADRVTRRGDAANKIGTYLKALAAFDNGLPFYVALPSSTFDWKLRDGVAEIPIEERPAHEVTHVTGLAEDVDAAGGREQGRLETVRICPADTPARNFGFDVTPARLVSGLITERGLCRADEQDILRLFPERRAAAILHS